MKLIMYPSLYIDIYHQCITSTVITNMFFSSRDKIHSLTYLTLLVYFFPSDVLAWHLDP